MKRGRCGNLASISSSTRDAPWYVVPADDKENARLIGYNEMLPGRAPLPLVNTHGERTPAGHAEGMRAILIGTNKELKMPGNPRDTIVSAERRFPVRIRIVFRPAGSANATPK